MRIYLHVHHHLRILDARYATATFYGALCGLFQSERADMLRMGEVSEVDHQAMQPC